jgi:superfamily I DNA/RNA helicase
MDEGCQQIALIGRKQAAIFPYQVLLSSEKIPYNVEADIDIFEGEAMNSLQEIIKIIYRAKLEDNDDPIEEVLSVLDKVNKYPLKRADRLQLTNYLQQQGVETYEEAICKLRECKDKVIGIQMDKLCNAAEKLVESSTVHEFMCCIEQDFEGLDKDYNKADRDNHYKEPQFFRLTKLSQKYGDDFRRFYRDIDRARKQGELSRVRNNTGSGNGYLADTEIPVHLLTATRSKGHEFDAVIILEANDSEWPSKLADNIEEERRLFYVAMTRAKKYLYFITSKEDGVSRFISEAGIQ